MTVRILTDCCLCRVFPTSLCRPNDLRNALFQIVEVLRTKDPKRLGSHLVGDLTHLSLGVYPTTVSGRGRGGPG